uniref:Tudor domain-containing protein Tdr8 n=1 Tax=Locusta migratoria TaxID=7004 RepID=A0AAU7J8I6_LOCMI
MDPCKSACEKTEPGTVIFSIRKQVPFPSDVLTDGSISQMEVPEAITIGSVIPVIVTNVNTPSKFWMTLVGPWFSERLDAMYGEMQEFYDPQHENYHLPSSVIKPGQFCVCLYARKWLRAKILEVVHANLVGVFFVDYGGTVFVTNDTLRLMHNRFTVVPTQCFRAYISGVKAKDAGEWPSDVCEYFRKEVGGKKVRVKVVRLFRRTYTFAVAVLDDADRNIADLMLMHGLAEVDLVSTIPVISVNAKSETEQHERASLIESVKNVGDTLEVQAEAQSRPEVKATSTQEPRCSGNRIAKWSDISRRDVTFEGKRLLLVTLNGEEYFVFSEFVYTLAGLHEHVALEVMATMADKLPVWKLQAGEVRMFVDSLEGQCVAGLRPYRRGVDAPAVRLLPLAYATEVLDFFYVDDKYKKAVSSFVSSMLKTGPKGVSSS